MKSNDMDSETLKIARAFAKDHALRDPWRAYELQRHAANWRGIAWEFTFSTWWEIWAPYYHLRGRGKNGLCMARENDEGPYSVENVYLTTNLGNLRDYNRLAPSALRRRQETKERKEMIFAKSGSTSKASRLEVLSHITYKTHNSAKSTCNYSDEMGE